MLLMQDLTEKEINQREIYVDKFLSLIDVVTALSQLEKDEKQ